jgi:hypothetical protein
MMGGGVVSCGHVGGGKAKEESYYTRVLHTAVGLIDCTVQFLNFYVGNHIYR